MPKDYYQILGVPKNATDDDIKRAFRKKAHEVHPDKQGGDEAKFKEVNEAYQVLGDKQKRGQYDQFGAAGYEQFQQGGGFGGFGGGGFRQGNVHFDMEDLGGMFGDLFGGAMGGNGGRTRERRGRHIEMDVQLTFKEAAFGAEKELSIYKAMKCDGCGGDGAAKGSKTIDCSRCAGAGRITQTQRTMFGTFQTAVTCDRCNGRGTVPEKACTTCTGTGVRKGQKKLAIKIPAGIGDGEVLRVGGEGEAAPYGGASGDLYVTARVKPDPRFTRNGFNVLAAGEIDVPLAALGGTIDVPTIDGDVTLKIPAGTQPGTVFRLKERGIPYLKRTGRGDMYVEAKVVIPKKLSRKQKKALEEWGE